jgi:hypothetical protein
MTEKKSVWETLSAINVNDHAETKNGMTYLSWAWAWGVLKKHYPLATFEKHVSSSGVPYEVDINGFAYVTVSVTVEGLTHTEVFPVLDHRNRAVQGPDSFQVNSSLQRALTKAISYHGLGHYIYAGEDLPEETAPQRDDVSQKKASDKPSPEKSSASGGSGMIKKTFMEFIPVANDLESLIKFYKDNKHALDQLGQMDKVSHAEVMKAFSARKDELQKGAE